MIILDTTTRKLEVLLTIPVASNQLPVVASYLTYVAGSSFTPGTTQTQTNNTTAVTIVPAPTSGTTQVKYVSIQNADVVSATVTVRYNDNGTTRNLVVVTLSANDQLVYEDGEGWSVLNSVGSLKNVTTTGLTSGSVQSGNISSGAINQVNFSSGLFAISSGNWFDNKLINGGMPLCQRYNPTLLTAITSGASASDTYSADRWKCACSSGSMVLYQRWDNLSSGVSSGISARYWGRWVIGGSGKFAVYQGIESVNSQPLKNGTLSFQFNCRTGAASSGLIVQMGVLQTNSGVSATDSLVNSLVSGWSPSTSGTNPVWASGISLIGPSTVVIPTSGIWNVFNNTVGAFSGHVNIIPAIWANQPLSSGAQFEMTEVGLYVD